MLTQKVFSKNIPKPMSLQQFHKRFIRNTIRTDTTQVELHGSKMGAIDDSEQKQTDNTASSSNSGTNHLFFLHGLLSKGQNWRSFALSDNFSTTNRSMYMVDLRNHGESDHHPSMTYKEMAEDVLRYADQREIDKFVLVGHNIGAKTAMTLSCLYPDRVSALICLDTLPLSFRPQEGQEFSPMMRASLENLKNIQSAKIVGMTRKAAIEKIKTEFSKTGMANLITGNIIYDPDTDNKKVKWCINLDAIIDNFANIVGFNDGMQLQQFKGPSLFVNASLSIGNLQKEGILPENE